MNSKKEEINMLEILKTYYTFAKKYKKYFIAITIFVTLVSFSRVLQKYLFKYLIDYGTDFTNGIITSEVFLYLALIIGITYLIVGLIELLSDWARFELNNTCDNKLMFDVKKRFFNHLIELSHGFHTSNRTGSLITRVTRGARGIESITDFISFEILRLLTEFAIIIILVASIDIISGLILLGIAFAFIIYSALILNKQNRATSERNIAEDIEKAHISDSFTNIETIKYFGKENYIKKAYNFLNKKTIQKQYNLWNFAKKLICGHDAILTIGLIILFILPIIKFSRGEVTLGDITFLYTVYLTMVSPLSNFTWRLRDFYRGLVDFKSITDYGNIEQEVTDMKNARPLKVIKGEIYFNNISFKYDKRKIIKNFDLFVKPTEKIALVGHSGSGKTTLAKLLYRLYDIQEGAIYIDTHDISRVKQESLRNEMSIVPQEGILFNDTIKNNILFSKPNATKKEFNKAIKAAQFEKFIKRLPEKEKTMVGERGIKLSGGEKQRLSIARALLADKKILVLDEATSALDSKTELEIQNALKKLMKGRTTIIIAHRLSTIMNADKIIVMDKGKIVQIGKHKELIKEKGPYKELWDLQKGGFIEE